MKSFFKNLLKQDPIQSSLNKLSLFDDTTHTLNLPCLMVYYTKQQNENKEQNLIDILISQLDKRKSVVIKIKVLIFLFSISKVSAYDIIELVTRKKIKSLTEEDKKKTLNMNQLSESNKSVFIQKCILVPIYNYMMKLSANEQLYKICQKGQVPCDDVFRKGTKIRYIWVFKIFNLINVIKPILAPILKLIKTYQKQQIYVQILQILKLDLFIYIDFITKCLQQTGLSNTYLLPYNDCLQYYESLKQYKNLKQNYNSLIKQISTYSPQYQIKFIQIQQSTFIQIEMLASRIQLISHSLRASNNKQNQRMVTDYNQKMEKYQGRINTLGN